MASRFRKVQSFQLDYSPCKLTQYVSERSGMHVVVVDRQGPKVEGYFGLATEILNDSGAPHTLEHLVFQASEKYPHRGLLDKLASRLFSKTNAWTATDHTAYTLETAGWAAFSQVLPVYLAHVLVPRITEATVTTEVWHVDGEGNDSGVVYSEMQAVEYTASWRTMARLQEIMYPAGSGFRYETGGLPEPLRNLTMEQIVEFHKSMYQPRNLEVIILGEVDHDELLRVLDGFEELIKDSIPPLDSPFKRPWIDSEQPPALTETVAAETTFPEEDESHGDVTISWFGPHCTDLLQMTALEVVSSYLTGSSAALLEKTIVETEQLASETSADTETRPNSLFSIYFSGVETANLEIVRDRAYAVLAELATKPLDMRYIADCLNRSYRRARFDADGFDSRLPSQIIMDFIYGKRDGSTLAQLETLGHYRTLELWSEVEWRAFIKKWLLDAHSVSVVTRPSQALAAEIKEREEKRLADRRAELGEEGLRRLGERLERVKKENEAHIPDEMLREWAIPPAESIPLFTIDTGRVGPARQIGNGTGAVQKLVDASDKATSAPTPLFIQFDEVPWKFVEVSVHVTVSGLPEELLPLVSVYVENFFKSPIRRDGKIIDHEQVVKEIEVDTIDYHIDSAEWLGDKNSLMVSFSIETDKYARAIEWLRAVALDSIFDPERLLVAVGKLYAEVPYAKRNGKEMANQVSDAINMDARLLPNAGSEIVASQYLPRLKRRLKENPDEVVGWFEQIRATLFRRENMRALVVGDVSALRDPVAAWEPLVAALAPSDAPPVPITKALAFRTAEGLAPGPAGAVVVPITALDSSFLVSTGRGIDGYTDARLPVAMVAVMYLQMPEGPLWTTIRGGGLAYGAYIGRNINSGITRFVVYRSPDAAKALAAARSLIARVASGEEPISQVALEGAISQVVELYTDQASTPSSAGSMDFVWTAIRGLPSDVVARHLAAASKVTVDEVRATVRDLVLPLLEPGRCNVVVTCGKKMSEGMEKSLADMGFSTSVKTLGEYAYDYGLEGPASDDSGESDEEGSDEEGDEEDDDEEGSDEDEEMDA